jgi:hypothetical protein
MVGAGELISLLFGIGCGLGRKGEDRKKRSTILQLIERSAFTSNGVTLLGASDGDRGLDLQAWIA